MRSTGRITLPRRRKLAAKGMEVRLGVVGSSGEDLPCMYSGRAVMGVRQDGDGYRRFPLHGLMGKLTVTTEGHVVDLTEGFVRPGPGKM